MTQTHTHAGWANERGYKFTVQNNNCEDIGRMATNAIVKIEIVLNEMRAQNAHANISIQRDPFIDRKMGWAVQLDATMCFANGDAENAQVSPKSLCPCVCVCVCVFVSKHHMCQFQIIVFQHFTSDARHLAHVIPHKYSH